MSDDVPDVRATFAAISLFAVIALLIAWDVVADYGEGARWDHIAIELAVLLVAAVGIVLLWRQLYRARASLQHALVDAEQWRNENREILQGLGAAIERQFRNWQLSKAEADVALFLLKGCSHKEIAALRRTSERTIREQARSLYRKSGLAGRSSLSAFFLEDLLLPREQAATGSTPLQD
ncbi:MAG TPA: hypothetical protein VFE85_07540 [Woeseiaceae bacterium]|nr:hypothetical protein [Woeseiaceae bacterium]